MSKKILQVGRTLLQQKKGAAAIRYLYHGIRHDPDNADLFSCLGDAIKQITEYEIALRIYRKALHLARAQGNESLIKELSEKIENVFVVSPADAPSGPQIGFFIRSLMKMLSQLGKRDWF